jgi:hypothetical protein
LKATVREILALGPGTSAAWHGWPSRRGETAWPAGSPEIYAAERVEKRCYKLFREVFAASRERGGCFDDISEDEYEIELTAFEARAVASEMATLSRLMDLRYSAVSNVQPAVCPERLCAEDVDTLRLRLLEEAARLERDDSQSS